MRINKNLEEIVKKIEGSLIGIGIEDKKIIECIEKNEKIIECNLLECYIPNYTDKKQLRKINHKQISRKFKKNSTNNIICNLEYMIGFKERLIYDSIYIGNDKIYIYSNQECDEIVRKYKRYCNINIIKCSDGFIYECVINKQMNKINKFYYKTLDTFIDFIEIISNLLSDS